jgi:hypothetical protein
MASGGKKRPVVEEISLDRALELLNLHRNHKISAKSLITVTRDPQNTDHILAISMMERDVSLRPSGR